MKTKITEYTVRSFMNNVNRLDMNVHRQTHNAALGTVKLIKSAAENNGKRKFSVQGSSLIKSGCYTHAGLMSAYLKAL